MLAPPPADPRSLPAPSRRRGGIRRATSILPSGMRTPGSSRERPRGWPKAGLRAASGAGFALRRPESGTAVPVKDLEDPGLLHQRLDLGHRSGHARRQHFTPALRDRDGVFDPDPDLFVAPEQLDVTGKHEAPASAPHRRPRTCPSRHGWRGRWSGNDVEMAPLSSFRRPQAWARVSA